jgi:hypothetical protein
VKIINNTIVTIDTHNIQVWFVTSYSHGHGISLVDVIQLTLAVKQVLYISNPRLEFVTWMSICQSVLLCVTEFLSYLMTIKLRLHKFFRIDSKITDEFRGRNCTLFLFLEMYKCATFSPKYLVRVPTLVNLNNSHFRGEL